MQNKLQCSNPLFTDPDVEQESPFLKIFFNQRSKVENVDEELGYNSTGSDGSADEIAQDVNENSSHPWSEGSWAYRRRDFDEEIPSLEVRHEALKRIWQSLENADGRSSRHESSRNPGEKGSVISESRRGNNDEAFAKLQDAVEKRVSENFSRLSSPSMASGDVLNFSGPGKPKTAPSGEQEATGKQYHFPELRSLIEDRIEETKVETLTNRLERELLRRQYLCNEQALMLQMLMNRVQDLEKRQPKRFGAGSGNGWPRHGRVNSPGVCFCTSNYVVEKATQTPSAAHDAEGVYVMVARNSGAKAKKVKRKIAFGYPEKVTEERKVSTLLDRKIVTQHIEFLPPIPDPFAKRRPREAKRPGWQTI